jgi:hypothetical protein
MTEMRRPASTSRRMSSKVYIAPEFAPPKAESD